MVVALTGVGTGVSCIIPFLLTREQSCVEVDFKGENALLTAERRRRRGNKIVILDTFKVVTQGKTGTLKRARNWGAAAAFSLFPQPSLSHPAREC